MSSGERRVMGCVPLYNIRAQALSQSRFFNLRKVLSRIPVLPYLTSTGPSVDYDEV